MRTNQQQETRYDVAISIAALRAMAAAGATTDVIIAAVEAELARDDAEASDRRRRERDRKRNWRASRGQDGTSRDGADAAEPVVVAQAADPQALAPDTTIAPGTNADGNHKKENPPHPLKKKHSQQKEPFFEFESDKKKEEGVVIARARPGTRLPDGWLLSETDRTFARALLPEYRIGIEFDKFRDYWRARAGPGAVKRDWSATWRNWCRKAVENGGGNGPTRQVHSNGNIQPHQQGFSARALNIARGETVDSGPGG